MKKLDRRFEPGGALVAACAVGAPLSADLLHLQGRHQGQALIIFLKLFYLNKTGLTTMYV